MARLGDLIEQIRGVSYKPEDLCDSLNEDGIPLLRASNIQDGKLNFEDIIYIDKKKVKSNQYLKSGDILVCTSSGSKELVGKAAFVENDLSMTFGAFCKVIRPKICCPKYIGHFFDSPYYRKRISASSAGANINNIRNEHIDEIDIRLPSTDEQKQISAVLDKVSDLISLRKQQLAKLDELVKARFVELFGNPLDGTAKYPIHQVGEVAEAVDPQPSHRTPPIEEGGIPYVSIKDCDYKTGTIDFDGARRVSRKVLEEHLNRYTLQDGDFVIGKIGTIGKPVFVPARNDYTLSANVVLVQPNNELVSPYFLKYSFESDFVERQFSEAKNSTSQAAFGIQKVRAVEVMNPDLDIQRAFERFVKQTDKSKLAVQQSLCKLELLKKALMQKYFG